MKIYIITLRDLPHRLQACMEALTAYNTPAEDIQVYYAVSPRSFNSQRDFCDHAIEKGYPEFKAIKEHQQVFGHLGPVHSYLECARLIEKAEDDGIILEDDLLLNLDYSQLCAIVKELKENASKRMDPDFFGYLRTWCFRDAEYEKAYKRLQLGFIPSVRDYTEASQIFIDAWDDPFYVGVPSFGWAPFFSPNSAEKFRNFIRPYLIEHLSRTEWLMAADLLLGCYMHSNGGYAVHPRSDTPYIFEMGDFGRDRGPALMP